MGHNWTVKKVFKLLKNKQIKHIFYLHFMNTKLIVHNILFCLLTTHCAYICFIDTTHIHKGIEYRIQSHNHKFQNSDINKLVKRHFEKHFWLFLNEPVKYFCQIYLLKWKTNWTKWGIWKNFPLIQLSMGVDMYLTRNLACLTALYGWG